MDFLIAMYITIATMSIVLLAGEKECPYDANRVDKFIRIVMWSLFGYGDTFWLNHIEPEYSEFVNIRINKVTLVELEKTESLRFGRFEKVITRNISNKMVVEYEVVNLDEYIRRIRLRKDNTELLKQFIRPTKGE